MTSLARSLIRSDPKREARERFARDVLSGLAAPQKSIPPKYFYDEEGSRLFEEITRLPEYYPTRTETRILERHGRSIAQLIPAGGALVEFGSGSSAKIRTLLRALDKLAVYVPVDISGDFLAEEAESLQRDFPHLDVRPVEADFTRPFPLPAVAQKRHRVGFFPGSTIGNFDPPEAIEFLRNAGRVLGRDAHLIVGVDLIKSEDTLCAAYDDSAGVTARFNLNLLRRINRDLGGDFDVDQFEHKAIFNRRRSRIEMHLVSRTAQTVSVRGRTFRFAEGESIHTESSYKFTLTGFETLARRAGWSSVKAWTDRKRYFSIHALAYYG